MNRRIEFQPPQVGEIRTLLRAMVGRHVLVVGDAMLDSYTYGQSARISPEAPVQVVQVDREESMLGGAANVARCLAALGARVTLACVTGDDAQAEQLIAEARGLKIGVSLIVKDPSRPTTVKNRIIAGKQHLLRIDREGRTPFGGELLRQFTQQTAAAAATVDAVLLSDYRKGLLNETVCAEVIRAAGKRPVLVDPKGRDWERYKGATIVKPNWKEAQAYLGSRDSYVLGLRHTSDDQVCEEAAHQLRGGSGIKNVMLTRSERGVSLACADGTSISFPSHAMTVRGEAGAGDVAGAVTCLALAAGAALPLAVWLGNAAAGAKVAKFATAAVLDHEILEVLGDRSPRSSGKIMDVAHAAELAASLRQAGKKIVFTNGCFDVLHVGHKTYLEKARHLGDTLLVGVNTDASIRRLKGPNRPLNPEQDRAQLISGFQFVDGVVLFAEDTPLKLIEAIKPDVLCKGADYKTKQDVVGWDRVESWGGHVELIELVPDRSSSRIIEKLGE
jgi:D-beta-D-heptose 7-phosphate kinase/D-beta-D-heptose 1-phosphate adenosyltransferase